jgi:NitT/TauT family transport system substrate-binding protein
MMKRRTILASLVAATSSVALPRLAVRAQTTLTKLRTLALPVDPCGALYYAKDLGYFEAAGLDVDISTPADYGAVISALVSGSADIVYGVILQIEQAYQKGLPVTIIAPAAMNLAQRPTNFLLVAKDSPIKSARDLNGKTIGSSPLKSVGTYAVEAWMNLHGADATTIKWADIPFPLCGEAIARGRIDAAFVIEPYATFARAETRLLGRPYEAISPYFLGAAYITTPSWAAAHPEVVRKFASAIHDASVWANKNTAKSALLVEKFSKVDLATINTMTRAVYSEVLTPEIVQPTIEFGAKYKLLDAAFPAKDLIYHPA